VIPSYGRKHPDDIDASFMGDSVAHWEGDTLVVVKSPASTTRPGLRAWEPFIAKICRSSSVIRGAGAAFGAVSSSRRASARVRMRRE
jgi:hypothetical protein